MVDNTLTLQILVAEANEEIASSIVFAIENQATAQIYEVNSDSTALDFFNNLSNLDLAIVGNYDDFPEFAQILFNPDSFTNVILGVSSKLKNPSVVISPRLLAVMTRENLIKQLPEIIQKRVLGGTSQSANDREFCKIRTSLLLSTPPLRSDIFIQISTEKFLKIFQKGSTFTESDYNKYKNKLITALSIKREDLPTHINAIVEYSNTILHAEEISNNLIQKLSSSLHLNIRDLVLELGVTPEVQEMTVNCMKLVLRAIANKPKTSNLLLKFANEPGKYITTHSMALAEISCGLAGLIGWQSDTTFQKLIYASLFHDISLSSDELARCQTMDEINFNTELILFDTVDDFENHPLRGAELANQMANLPADVGAIVSQHHENPEGTGFPKKLPPSRLNPLSCLFILAHELLNMSLNAGGAPINPKNFLMKHKARYYHGNFKEIIKALEDHTLDEK